MSKKLWKALVVAMFVILIASLAGCGVSLEVNRNIPLTDLAATFTGDAIDKDTGEILVPFDVGYSEQFESGAFAYDESALLLKMDNSYRGKLTLNLKKCGFNAMEKFAQASDGVWWRASLKDGYDVKVAIQKARSLPEVLIADYDYIYKTDESTTKGSGSGSSADASGILDDVLSNIQVTNQWHLTSCDIQKSWLFLKANGVDAGGSSSVVVAVIDTGVDYTHPDLKANMWINTAEIPGNGIDDDGNGYIDDVYGANTVADNGYADMKNTGNPMDDHGHGTHVAGIIAASNNKEGIVGVAYNVKIMAIKAGQATGVFNQSDIAEAILYAYEMGADVINMSFGGSACSIAVQDALSTAYTRSTLVAAAGNSGMPNELTDYYLPLPNYPAALSYVIGVMSAGPLGYESVFTNWDAYAYNSIEYEIYAPGEEIFSTLPGGRYGYLSGTSMAAPVVSGAAALLRSYYTDRDMYPSKFIAAQLCATSGDEATCINPLKHTVGGMLHNLPMRLNAYDALTKLPTPEVTLYNYYLFDGAEIAAGNSGDGVADAGETLNIGVVLRNRWGMSKNTVVTIDAIGDLGIANPYVEIITSTSDFEGVGTYSTKDQLIRDEDKIVVGTDEPLVIRIAENCPNDYLIVLNVTITCENALDEKDGTVYTTHASIEFWVHNGVVLPSQITEDMTLTKNNYYIIPNSTYIAEGVTVTVEPGTKIQFWSDDPNDPYADTYIAYLNVAGKFICNGSEDEPVELFPSEMMSRYIVEIRRQSDGYAELNYTSVTNPDLSINYADHCTFNQNYAGYVYYRYLSGGKVVSRECWQNYGIIATNVSNSVFYKIGGTDAYYDPKLSGIYDSCIFVDSSINYVGTAYENCVFMGNRNTSAGSDSWNVSSLNLSNYQYAIDKIVKNKETGSTYIVVRGDIEIPSAREFAKYLGGDFACIESQEEYDFFINNGIYGSIGLLNAERKWLNGEDYTLSTDIREGGYRYGVLTKVYEEYTFIKNEISFDTRSCRGNNWDDKLQFIIEIPGSIYVDAITLRESEVKIDSQSQYKILPEVTPATFDKSQLIYVSDDETVATVSADGVVTPHRKGQVTIYVYSPDYLAVAACKITVVEKIALDSIALSAQSTRIAVGESAKLSVAYSPADATERYVTFASSNPSVVSVDEYGMVTANAPGSAVITAQAFGKTAQLELFAVNPVKGIEFEEKFFVTYMGDTSTAWQPIVSPADATDVKIKWSSSNPEVAYVENGVLIRASVGTATIRAEVEGASLFAELNVVVNGENLSVSGLKVKQMSQSDYYTLAVTESNQLYVWGSEYRVPVKVAEDIVSAVFGDSYSTYIYIYAVNTSGELDQYYFSATYFNKESTVPLVTDVKKVFSGCYSRYSYYALTEDGCVWAWGQNDNGQLGDGTTTYRSAPVQCLVNNVVDIATMSSSVLFLDKDGGLWAAGGYNAKIVEPRKILTGVIRIEGGICSMGYSYIAQTADSSYSIDCSSFNIWRITNSSGVFYPAGYMISNGICYRVDYYYGDGYAVVRNIQQLSKVTNAERMFISAGNAYIVTADGLLYGLGNNDKRQLADLTTVNRDQPTRIFFGLQSSDSVPTIENVNISENILTEKSITLDFDTALAFGDQYGYIRLTCGTKQLSLYKTLLLDKLTLRPVAGFEVGVEYTLTIPAGALLSKYGVATEEIVYTFTFVNDTQIQLSSSSLENGAVLGENEFSAELAFTLAIEGANFGNIAVLSGGEAVEGVVITLEDSVLKVTGNLDYGEYVLYVPSGALADYVGGVNGEISLSFTVAEKIKLLSSSVTDGEERVDERENIVLTFTNALRGAEFANIAITGSNGENCEISVTLNQNVLTISHALAQGESYVLTIPQNALIDDLGNGNEQIRISFTTYSPVAMLYSSVEEGDDKVALTPSLRFEYNGEFALAEDKICVSEVGGEEVSFAVSQKGKIVEIIPERLTAGKNYSVTFETGALLDERGAESASYGVTFSTVPVTERFFWTADYISQYCDEYKWHNLVFLNNALLNDLNDTNVEHWLRIIANSSGTFSQIGIAGNYWGTLSEYIIEKQVVDFDDYQSLQDIVTGAYLKTAPENVWPFVTDAYLLDKNGERVFTVGNETVTFVVEFNRDMDVTQNLRVRFGSSLPYAEYEISGGFVSARRWEGTYTLKTTIENGNQYLNIENGRAADDRFMKLYEHVGRFMFEIDTTSAQAMIMQGVATDTGINLSWVQDDFETLAGYNVYRSDKEDGYYTRLNDYVLAADENTFFDDTVEPGKVYYYNFTVVKTDLSESTPSGKIVIMSKDTMAPDIYHSPVRTAYTGSNLIISATITDNLSVASATLYYRQIGTTEWKSTLMTAHNSRYSGIIPADALTLDGVEYYIDAFDGISHTLKGDAKNAYVVTVKLAVDGSSLGDVDGDGTITTKDALMLLQAANDQLNLTEEQFLRADINGDKELSAAEALRILQYVSGKVTTIVA